MKNIECVRNCPVCNIKMSYSTKYVRNRAERDGRICHHCSSKKCLQDPTYLLKLNQGVQRFQLEYKNNPIKRKWSQEVKDKIKKNAKCLYGKDNLSYGKSTYQWWIEKYGVDIANQKMEETKKKWSQSSSGKNNSMYGKPSPNGSGNGWSGWYNNWFFRSFRELSYMINVIEKNGWTWESGEQKKYKISYTDWEGKVRNYFPDFIVNGNVMVECKPKKLHISSNVISKKTAAEIFCKAIGMTYELTDPEILDPLVIKILHDNGKIKLTERYEKKYIGYIST